jgi:hypothetical protein
VIALNLISLFIVSALVTSLFRNKYIKLILSILFGVFFCLQLSSLYLGNSFIDFKFFFHFNLNNTLSIAGGFIKEIIIFSFLLILIPYIFFFLSINNIDKKRHLNLLSVRIVNSFSKFRNYRLYKVFNSVSKNYFVKISLFLASFAIIFITKDGIYSNLKELWDITTTTETEVSSLQKDIENLGVISSENEENNNNNKAYKTPLKNINKEGYTKKEDLTAEAGGKNIIIISLESFERAFLHDENKELTPNLRRLKKNWSYYDMNQNDGSIWTAGSLYTVFTGFPCFFAGFGNDFFQNSKECKIVTIGDVLKKCGYISYHLSDNADFAGTRDILKLFKIDSILDGTFHGKYQVSNMPWGGVSDKDLFSEAKNIILRRNSQKPFFLFISTLSTHCPNGFVDDRMLQFIEKQKTTLETAALSTDWLVGDFIEFLQKEELLQNTIVYLFPDHIMLCDQEIFNKTKEKRGLWFMTNADKKDLSVNTDNFYQIDIAKNILSGAKIKHNAKFLSDFIEEDKEDFIKKNIKKITALNSSSIIRDKTVGESLSFEKTKNQIICLVNRDTLFVQNKDSLANNNLVLPMNAELKILPGKLVVSQEMDRYCKSLPSYYLIVSIKNNYFNFEWAWDNEHSFKISKASSIKLNSKNIQDILLKIKLDADVPIAEKGTIKDSVIIKEITLVEYLTKVMNNNSKIVIISAFDDAGTHFGEIKPILDKVGLKESLEKTFGWSYLSVFSRNKVYYESSSIKMRYKKLLINNVPISLKSGGLNSNSSSNIIIDDKEYSMCKRGLNIVIFDKETKKVNDSFNVNTSDYASLKIMRNKF